ncbi:uncharacterized protein LOC128385484 [Panonychus citri]|uniref:uncharacterized protein LOC128385484 n=1 Tax=Panonychus citri TaxID=50023 RepID=UPI002306FAD9|nr:uncharacterized protein LOC128385484 [Panonychus citri]
MNIGRPQRLGYFSCHICPDGKSETYHEDKSSLTYLCPDYNEIKRFDLTKGFEEIKKWERVFSEKLHILQWIIENIDKLTVDSNSGLIGDFICHSSRSLKTLMVNLLYNENKWTMIAVKVRGVIILNEMDNGQCKEDFKVHRLYGRYAGYKLYEILTCTFTGSNLQSSHDNGNHDSFYTVNKLRINNLTLLYSDRVHCVADKSQFDKPLDEMETVQIRSRPSIWSKDSYRWYWIQRKCYWLAEAKFSGNDKIICGLKGRNNQLDYVETLSANQLEKDQDEDYFSICGDYFVQQLSLIKSMVNEELVPFKITCDNRANLNCFKLNQSIEQFIPSWFIEGKLPESSNY